MQASKAEIYESCTPSLIEIRKIYVFLCVVMKFQSFLLIFALSFEKFSSSCRTQMLLTEGESDYRSYFLGYVHLLSICSEVSGMIS